MAYEKFPTLAELVNLDRLEFFPSDQQILCFCTLMQKGCFVRVQAGWSLSDLLCDQLRISPNYIKNEIKVNFLDNSPVDDLDVAIIKDREVLALPAGVPGFAGAAMRRDGLSWMLNSITYHDNVIEHEPHESIVNIKLFNQVMADLGVSFLRRGVFIKFTFLKWFLERFIREFLKDVKRMLKNREIIYAVEITG